MVNGTNQSVERVRCWSIKGHVFFLCVNEPVVTCNWRLESFNGSFCGTGMASETTDELRGRRERDREFRALSAGSAREIKSLDRSHSTTSCKEGKEEVIGRFSMEKAKSVRRKEVIRELKMAVVGVERPLRGLIDRRR